MCLYDELQKVHGKSHYAQAMHGYKKRFAPKWIRNSISHTFLETCICLHQKNNSNSFMEMALREKLMVGNKKILNPCIAFFMICIFVNFLKTSGRCL